MYGNKRLIKVKYQFSFFISIFQDDIGETEKKNIEEVYGMVLALLGWGKSGVHWGYYDNFVTHVVITN